MSYFITVDAVQNITGLFLDEGVYAPVPADAIQVTPDQAELLRFGFHKYNYINGELVLAKQPNPRIAEIKAELVAIDAKRIRPISEGDTAYLATLNAQAVALRAELSTLPPLV